MQHSSISMSLDGSIIVNTVANRYGQGILKTVTTDILGNRTENVLFQPVLSQLQIKIFNFLMTLRLLKAAISAHMTQITFYCHIWAYQDR